MQYAFANKKQWIQKLTQTYTKSLYGNYVISCFISHRIVWDYSGVLQLTENNIRVSNSLIVIIIYTDWFRKRKCTNISVLDTLYI